MFTNIYSPLQPVFIANLQNFWVKRDDLIDPFISGNKWRKVKYILEEAFTLGKSHLVTFGGAYSNHLVAVAAAAARSSLKSSAFVRGEAVENEMLLLCKMFGMQLIFTDRTTYQNKTLLFQEHFGQDPEAIFIDEGGAGKVGMRGCTEIVDELPTDVDHIFCAAGTGTTAAGLLRGIVQSGRKSKLHVIPVLKAESYFRNQINELSGVDCSTEHLKIYDDYHFGGYAKQNDALLKYMIEFIRSTGILIDPIYTAKLFYAINDLSQKGKIPQHSKIVALHTGGLLGTFGLKDKLHKYTNGT